MPTISGKGEKKMKGEREMVVCGLGIGEERRRVCVGWGRVGCMCEGLWVNGYE